MLLPALLMRSACGDRDERCSPGIAALLIVLLLVFNFAGELLERYLFFAAVVAPKMPGAPAT